VDARLIVALSIVGVVVVYAVLSQYWTSRSAAWYESLPRPSWQPPNLVFALVWPLNFLLLGISGWVMGYTQPRVASITFGVTLTGSVVFALSWAYLFYVPHRLGLATASLMSAAVLAWGLVSVAWVTELWVGVMVLPYAVWMTMASALSLAYARIVPEEKRQHRRSRAR
jgi:benzodiazapine receptor